MNNIDVNTWFHHLGGKNLLGSKNKKFLEYRKKWNEWPTSFYVGNFPLFIDIEVTNMCNLKCPFCFATISKKRDKKGFITKKNVEKIIDEGSDNGLYGVKFNNRGEPLLHQEIDYFVKYAKQKKLIDVYFNTNAVFLTEEMSNKLIDAGLDRISISFEGTTKEIYEKNRVGSNYEKVLSNIEKLKSLRDKLNVNHPKIRIQTIKLPMIDIEKYKKFWISRVDEVAFLDYQNYRNNIQNNIIVSSWACPQLWQRMAVMWDGKILPCNHGNECYITLGNINNKSIKKCWDSIKLNEIRKKHSLGLSHEIKVCNNCCLRDNQINKNGEDI